MSFLERLRAGLRRTTDQLVGRFDRLDAGGATRVAVGQATATVSVDTLDSLEEILIEADIGVSAAMRLIEAVRDQTDDADLRSVVKRELRRLLEAATPAPVRGGRPRVVLVVGVNGTGKTTTVGRLARLLTLAGERPVICAADTFRAAAVEQLEVWARRVEADFVRARPGADPAAVVFDAISAGKARGRDVVLVDTAGRLHTRTNLMSELDKIRRVAARAVDGAPHETLLVLDATVGQNGLAQARAFLESVGVTGIVLTKLDGTAKGGIAVAITAELGVPIRYVGVGEQLDDLVPFSAAEYVEALFEPAW
ncbi:MAG: signal recognition particle-docking protein FtsY [Acidobacteria bacterium]|nr:MAG: signal recognition particle-docking protein FtsY [Acidobacteriota bacterium]